VHDTHANIWNSNNKTLHDYFGKYYFPAQTAFTENKLVVTGYYTDSFDIKNKLQRGDIISKVNHVPVEELVKKKLPEIPASNYETQLRDLPKKLLRGNTDKVEIEIDRDGKKSSLTIDRLEASKLNMRMDYDPSPGDSSYKIINGNIGYIFPGKYKNKQLPAIKELFKNTKGMVIDMRCYPSEFMPFSFGEYIKPANSPFVKFTGGSVNTPGLFSIGPPISNGTGNPDYYKNKIVVIVNAATQSQAEYTTMAFQSAPQVTVIGSTTAAADGNVSPIYLPGNIFTYISGIGVYYPDGTETQRAGVKINVPIKPTISGIKEGRDELLEKAIEIIERSANTQPPKKGF
jgi:C-terminal processing protease CtpA/Prc